MSTTTSTREAVMTQDLRATATELRDDGPPRDLLMTHRGMVAAANHFAAQAGVEILRRGGNAVDAAIAAAAVMTTVEPWNGHLGGDTFMLISRPDRHGGNEVIALNGSGAAPLAATAAEYLAAGGFPDKGLRTSTVPGTPSAWAYAADRFGTLPLGELLEAGAWYAEYGVPVTSRLHASLKSQAVIYKENPDAAAVFLPNGEIPPIGGTLRQPGLARSLTRIGDGGHDAFYRGDMAAQMVEASTKYGGLFALEDFANHKTDEIAPLAIDYRGYTVFEQPPVSQGIIVLLALNILENVDLASFGQGSAQHIHHMVEALKLAVADKDRFIGDPAFVEMPLDRLLSKEHAAEQAAKIDPRRAMPATLAQQRQPDTTYLCAADASGTTVSYIHSLFTGAGVVLGETGVLMNSRLLGFNLEDGHPNCLAPGKRPVHTLNPWLVQKDGQPVFVGGTPGAQWQVQTNLQILTNLLDFDLDVQRAQEAPRFTVGHQLAVEDPTITLESRAHRDVVAELESYGHPVVLGGPWSAGASVQLIARNPESGLLQGSTEVRRPGCTVAGY